MKTKILLALTLLIFCSFNKSSINNPDDFFLTGVKNPVVLLNGKWEVCTQPFGDFWKTYQKLNWNEIMVPGELMMQGFSIKNDEPFLYKKEIKIPADYREKKIYLQFDGVYSYAKLWVNGTYIKDHHGGFTRWKADITKSVQAGESAVILLEVTDRYDDVSYASGYAKHPIGGILRDVKLLALPENPIEEVIVNTELDADYKKCGFIRFRDVFKPD